MASPGPIKRVAQTIKSNIQSRKEEKQRAADQGYKYNRNVIHDTGAGKSRNIKGNVSDAIERSARDVKQDAKLAVNKAKQKVETKVNQVKKTIETRKAMKTADERGMANRATSDGKAGKISGDFIELNSSGKGFNAGKKPSQKPKTAVKGKNVIQKAVNRAKFSAQQSRGRRSGIK